jgi:predicted O-linked N-acetylglucosamine transferase (SPINDLY family)
LNERFRHTMPECADRVIYANRTSTTDQFRNLIAVCDVMLDSVHIGGGMTSLDGFVAGTPIVTWPGELMRSRFTAAWCRLLEVEECIAANAGQYVEIALRVAYDPGFRTDVSGRIKKNCGRLFEDDLSVAEFEDFFENAYAGAVGRAASL